MRLKTFSWLLMLGLLLATSPLLAQQPQASPPQAEKAATAAPQAEKAKTPEPDPRQVLKKMCDYLKGLQQFSCQVEITEDVLLTTGQKIQLGKTVEVSVRRPDRMRAESKGDTENRQMLYDGKTITLLDRSRNVYTTIRRSPGD